jgi:YidC/Oxa1 family membrane protein insertase
MIGQLWFVVLYQPVFNALIWIYTNIAGYNLGWAVVWLTIFLRILLLPLTFISEKNVDKDKQLEDDVKKVALHYKNDPIAQKEQVRKLMKKHRASPWAKVLMLGIQALVFILLYQVFIHGISGEKIIKNLYSFVNYPGKINTSFYGFQIGHLHDTLWAGITAGYLFLSILIRNLIKRSAGFKADVYFLIFFPVFTFVLLWFLPMVKSLFILTTMIFSDIVTVILGALISPKKAEEDSALHH